MYRVTTVNLTERTKDSWDYDDLLSALRVAKTVDTSTRDDLSVRPAMSDEFFNNHLWELLTYGFVYVREDVMVFLWELTENGIERPVVRPEQFLIGLSIPSQPISCDGLSPVGESHIVRGTD